MDELSGLRHLATSCASGRGGDPTGRGVAKRTLASWLLLLSMVALLGAPRGAEAGPAAASGTDPALVQSAAAAAAEMRDWRTKRESPAQRTRRRESRTEHRGLGRDGARALARSRFPEAFASDAARPFLLPNGMEIGKLLSEQTASVQTATGESLGVLNAYGPLAVERDGKLSSVRLGLEARDGGWVPSNPRAAYHLPERASQAVQLDRTGVRFRFLDAGGVDAALDDNRLFYANAGTDLDYVLTPKAAGAEALWQIRSEAAPETVRLAFDLPAGATLQRASQFGEPESGQAIVVKDADGNLLATVTPPLAYAADGMGLEVQTEIEGNVLSMTVKHVGEDVMYPILLDPQVAEVWATAYGFQNCGNTTNATGGVWTAQQYLGSGSWAYDQQCDSPFHVYGYGLYSAQRDGGWYTAGAVAQYSWWAPANSYIQSISWAGLRHEPAYDYTGYTNAFVGIHRDCCPAAWMARYEWGNAAHWNYTQYASEAAETTRVVTGISSPFTGNYWNGGMHGLEGAYIVVNDRFNPENILLKSITPALIGSTWGSPWSETPWMNVNSVPPQLAAHAEDRGLGLTDISLVDSLQRWTLWTGFGSNCTGSRTSNPMCPLSQDTPVSYATAAYQLPEGITEVRLRAKDINDRYGYGTPFHIKNDRSAPVIELSGPLYANRSQRLGGSTYQLHSKAVDGSTASPSTRRSGAKRIDVYIDGVLKASTGDRACGAAGSCVVEHDFYLTDESVLEPLQGLHIAKVVAYDQLGHSSSSSFYFELDRPYEQSYLVANAGPADLSAVTGDLGTEACTADPARYCGQDDYLNSAAQATMAEPILMDAPMDSAGEPIARAATIRSDGWGLSDEHGEIFDIPAQQDLELNNYRKIIDWDIATKKRSDTRVATGASEDLQLKRMDKWYAKLPAFMEPLVSFRTSDSAPATRGKPASPAEFIAAINDFRRKYPRVKKFTAWNEPNLGVYRSDPVEAARRFNDLWKACKDEAPATATMPKADRCQALAGDFVDKSLTTDYLEKYINKAGVAQKTKDGKITWAFHLYETQYERSRETYKKFLLATSSGPVWITESGVYQWHYATRKDAYGNTVQFNKRPRTDADGTAAAADLKYLFNSVLPYRALRADGTRQSNRVQRFYYYQWADMNSVADNGYPPYEFTPSWDTTGTGLTREPWGTPAKPYCVYLNREDDTARNNCP